MINMKIQRLTGVDIRDVNASCKHMRLHRFLLEAGCLNTASGSEHAVWRKVDRAPLLIAQ